MSNKDELIQLLKNGFIEEFNQARPHHKDELFDFSEVDLRGAELTGINLSNTDLTGTDFGEAEILQADFSNSDLTSTDFTQAVIKNSDFIKASLTGTKFNGTKLKDCDFAEADFSGADLSDANLTSSDLCYAENLTECIFDSFTSWPDTDGLPEDFEPEYIEDLSSLKDGDDDLFENDYAY